MLGSHGYKFVDPSTSASGIRTLVLRATSTPGAARVTLRGKGAGLEFQGLPLAPDVRVQLGRSGAAVCWESLHPTGSIRQNDTEHFASDLP